MRYIVILFLVTLQLSSAQLVQKRWKSGESFSLYLAKNGIPPTLLHSISKDDTTLLSEIQADEEFCELVDGEKVLQTLIPIGDEMQIHLYRDEKSEQYKFAIIPIETKLVRDTLHFDISSGFYSDMNRYTHNPRLGYLLKRYYGSSVKFKYLQKGDRVAVIYEQRSRLGIPYGKPTIKASLIHTHSRDRFIFADKRGTYYNNINKNIPYSVKKKYLHKSEKRFVNPLKKMRITSKFTYKRWHPLLHKYRPHLGIDVGAKRGTPIYATNDGKVIHAGLKGGYGKTVKIRHDGGFVSLYAHQSKLAVHVGQYVKAGQLIGYIGSTGRSTGPHIHFGLYKNRRAVDPQKYLNIKSINTSKMRTKTITKHRVVPIKNAKRYKRALQKAIAKSPKAHEWERYKLPYDRVEDRSQYEK